MLNNALFRILGAALLLLLAGGAAQAQQPSKRIALVIGNGNYRAVDRLTNPANDAKLIARTLQSAGFTLVGGAAQLDLDKSRFDRAVQDFGRAVQGAEVALFYYSGHGMQVQGENWLVPVDANPSGAKDLDFQMVDASLVLRQMEGAGTKLNLVILDACRNNPFAVRGVRGTQSGLAEMHAPEGTLISYATQPGNVAADGASGDSPYTTALAETIRRPGLDMFQVFNQVGLAVKQETGGTQQPWVASSPISGNFYFFNGPVTITPQSTDPETAFWLSITGSVDANDFRSYLRSFPNGRFADLAQRRIASLTSRESPSTTQPGAAPSKINLSRLDGTWEVTLVCSTAADGAAGYTFVFPSTVSGGHLHGEYGTPGQPSSLTYDGTIQADGSAVIIGNGLTGAPAYSVGRVARGAPYSYHLLAQFDGAHGHGKRTETRPCAADFARQ